MIRRTIAWAVFVAALLLLTLPGYFLQERVDEPTLAEVHNDTADAIWLASDSAVSDVLLELGPGETGPTCLRDAGDVDVYDTDPTADPRPTPLSTVEFEGEDFCDGLLPVGPFDAQPGAEIGSDNRSWRPWLALLRRGAHDVAIERISR